MKTCPKCGHQFFECTADTFDTVNFTVTIDDDGSINSEESGKEYVGETEWHGDAECVSCGYRFDRNTGRPLSPDERLLPYTVLLLYPDYIADEFGKETYLAHVMAQSAREAVTQAQENALVDNGRTNEDPEDFHVLLTICGYWNDLTPDRR
uniref:Uncharacterized protein n=1 Tax=viral metagenome TaxID=1070528 RepID=A0A6M3XLK9_9ZZZZ